MKKSFIILLFLVSVLSVSIVAAFTIVDEGGSCTSTTECIPGTVCEDGVCTTYCSIGETECSDGVDNDGDGAYDFWGACFTDSTDTELKDCSVYDFASECESNCIDIYPAPDYYGVDPDCRSPLDNDESGDPGCADGVDNEPTPDGLIDFPNDPDCDSPEDTSEVTISLTGGPSLSRAAEVQTFWQKVWDWLMFWN